MNRLLTVFGLLVLISCQNNKQAADTIFIKGNIYTVNENQPHAEAVAVVDGKIMSVGETEDMLKYRGDRTLVVDLEGKTMLPGFIDSHAHFMGLGYAQINVDLSGVSSYDELIEIVRMRAETLQPGQWIVGRGWHQDKWDSMPEEIVQGFPTHHALSKATPDNPVFLNHASGHAALVNAKAMEISGVNAETKPVEGGEFFTDLDGNPTGIFNETAQGLITEFIPANDEASDQEALEKAVSACLSHGVTSFHDAGVGRETIDLYKKNIESGKLKVRIYAMLDGSDAPLLKEYFELGPEIAFGDDFLTVRSVKLYSDGALGSRGALLLAPYSDMPATRGHSVTPSGTLSKITEMGINNGFQICTHAIGDSANREVLDIYERAFQTQDCMSSDFRFRIEHAQHLHPEDIPRFAELGVIAAMQAVHLSSDRPWAIDRLGRQRIEDGAYVWQSLLKSGAVVTNGTDAPVEPIDPLENFYASVTRKTLKGIPPGGFEPAQKMTREEALKSYTLDAAFGAFEEDIKGSIEVGKYADFVLLDRDIMSVPEQEILQTNVLMTVVDGDPVFTDDAFQIRE